MADLPAVLRETNQKLAVLNEQLAKPSIEWLTPDDVAERLQVSSDTVLRMIKAGKLKATALQTGAGRGQRQQYRIHEDWLADCLQPIPVPQPVEPTRRRRRAPQTPDFIGG